MANHELAAQIVAAYLRRNQVAADQLPGLIQTVHQTLADLGKPAEPAQIDRTPAVPIRRSVSRDFVVCLECGWKGTMLKRHISTAHGLTAGEYLARWNLPREHALTAPAYSERRSTLAKQLGLGRGGRRAAADRPALEPVAATATPRRRGRPRSTATAT